MFVHYAPAYSFYSCSHMATVFYCDTLNYGRINQTSISYKTLHKIRASTLPPTSWYTASRNPTSQALTQRKQWGTLSGSPEISSSPLSAGSATQYDSSQSSWALPADKATINTFHLIYFAAAEDLFLFFQNNHLRTIHILDQIIMLLHSIHILLLNLSFHFYLFSRALVRVQLSRIIALMSLHATNVERILQQLQTRIRIRLQLPQLCFATGYSMFAPSPLIFQTQRRDLIISK